MITIRQGESMPRRVRIRQDGVILVPDMVADIKVCFGDLRFKMSEQTLIYEEDAWRFWPTQEQTMSMTPGYSMASIHIKYSDGAILIRDVEKIYVQESRCAEVF